MNQAAVEQCKVTTTPNYQRGTEEKGVQNLQFAMRAQKETPREMSSYTSSDEPSCCGTVQSDDNTQLSERDGRKECTKPTIRYEVRLTDLQRATFYSFSINTLIFWYRSMQNTIFFVVLK
uniref:Uncharacterized protein n=1 Tax=Ditylum brightwellii TaxID=49249 RepID=A0A7S4RWS5_9STRA